MNLIYFIIICLGLLSLYIIYATRYVNYINSKIRTFITFDASGFPDDAVWDKDDHLDVPSGQAVLSAIKESLEKNNCRVSPLYQRCDFGWEINIENSLGSFFIVIQEGDNWLLIVERRGIVRSAGKLYKFLRLLDSLLKADNRFSNIEWFTRNDYEKPGELKGSTSP